MKPISYNPVWMYFKGGFARCLLITTIYEIAKHVGVSPATVSRALSGKGYVRKELREKILQVAKEMDYHPNTLARSLVTGQSFIIGLVLPDITNPFFPAIARGVEDVAHRNGYNVILCNTDGSARKEADYLGLLRSKRVDGVIFTTSQVATRHVRQLVDSDIPVVLADRRMNVDCDFVVVDSIEGAYKATSHLIGLGHSAIGLITGPQKVTTSAERIEGYSRALRDRHIAMRDELICEGDYKENSGYRHTKKLLGLSSRPTAIFACNDLMAMGALAALEEKGIRVPEEVAVVGYDDIPFASVIRPRLTTVVQPKYEIGSIACEILLERMKDRDKPRQEVFLKPNLMIRESSVILEVKEALSD
jgi:DNA-binding LacI/PurR family transcriptional regulator